MIDMSEETRQSNIVLFAGLFIGGLIAIMSYNIGFDNGHTECLDNYTGNTHTVQYDTTYWKHIPLPLEAKKLLNGSQCYHSDCFEVRANNSICYIEIGKYFGTGVNSTCYFGDGNLVVIDCSYGVCIPSERTTFDLDVTEKVNIFYYNDDTDECCVVSHMEADRAIEYYCFDSTLYDCITRVIKPEDNIITNEGGE